ncbi:MAG: replication-associated recombination protein A [Clostridiaceae bacterium]|mgnify:CR=1 FL=1|nr:replication-associated recombination protein A [Clostridiaceae bacterium]
MKRPLADAVRPLDLSQVVGQRHLLSEDKILYKILSSGNIPNMIFYGPSGTGKTTVANIAARVSDKQLYKLNATNASVADIKSIISELDGFSNRNGVILYLDEIQNFNKKQQQSLLEFIENGQITLIAATTENPYFYIYNAILSRCTVFEFLPISPDDILQALRRVVEIVKKEYQPTRVIVDEDALIHIANSAGGDVRKAINALEVAVLSESLGEEIHVTLDIAVDATQKKALRYDKDGDSHYDVLSAFQKSIRGSDPDAAVHYLARLIEAGDLPSICRRLLVIACEDIGLAYPNAITIVKSCVDAAFSLGLPEARIPLAQAVIFLATCPKSNSAICAIDAALHDVRTADTGDVPLHLKDSHYEGAKKMGRGVDYKYPHSYPNNYVKQQYLPDLIKDKKYYIPQNNKFEQNIKEYWDKLKNL